eukprot:5002402-Prymnesium_polylepis.1
MIPIRLPFPLLHFGVSLFQVLGTPLERGGTGTNLFSWVIRPLHFSQSGHRSLVLTRYSRTSPSSTPHTTAATEWPSRPCGSHVSLT